MTLSVPLMWPWDLGLQHSLPWSFPAAAAKSPKPVWCGMDGGCLKVWVMVSPSKQALVKDHQLPVPPDLSSGQEVSSAATSSFRHAGAEVLLGPSSRRGALLSPSNSLAGTERMCLSRNGS